MKEIFTAREEMGHLIFPSTSMQTLSSLIHFFGVSFLAHCLSRSVTFNSVSSFLALSWARMCVVLVFVDSWLFVLISGVLIFGVGLEHSSAICSTAIYLCIGCYGTSKLFIYCFLIEKVHIVWTPTAGKGRLSSRIYIVCMVTVALYGVIAALLLIGRIHYFRDDGACVVGLKKFSSLPLLAYDLYVNIFMTTLFLWPLLRSTFLNARVKRVATRTLFAAGVALTTSTINVVVLTVLDGKELGWVCLGSCGTDVFFNAVAIYWVTAGSSTVRLPSTTSVGLSGPSKAPFSDRQISAADVNLCGKPACPSSSALSHDDKYLPNVASGTSESGVVGGDVFPTYLPKRESVVGGGIGKITFAPLEAVQDTEIREGRRSEHRRRSSIVKTNKDPDRQQQQQQKPKPPPTRPSLLKSILSAIASPFRASDHVGGDDICSSIQITVTTEYELDDRPADPVTSVPSQDRHRRITPSASPLEQRDGAGTPQAV